MKRPVYTVLRLVSCLLTVVSTFSIAVVVAMPAYGYTDPGSGALIWQVVMAAFVGASFYLRRIISRVSRRRKSDQDL
jgi:hypothetical protein